MNLNKFKYVDNFNKPIYVWYYDIDSKRIEKEKIFNIKELEEIFLTAGFELKVDPHTYDLYVKEDSKDLYVYFDHKYIYFSKNKEELKKISVHNLGKI